MPKLTGDTLLQRALEAAINDRESLAESYGKNDPERKQFLSVAKAFQTLRGKKLKDMDDASRTLAWQALYAAEHWEESLADSNHMRGPIADDCMRKVRLYKQFRHAEFGKTTHEVMEENTTAVPITEILARRGLPPSAFTASPEAHARVQEAMANAKGLGSSGSPDEPEPREN
jgi:hypothetical protein